MPGGVSLRSEAGVIALLGFLALILFLVTNYGVRGYRAKERQLGREWFASGNAALTASQPARAVEAFQTALRYAPDDQQYRYALVDSLLAAGRTEQARAHLLNMWERQPANGTVNLQLGRIAARRRDVVAATHYYHNAIYGIWDDAPQQHRVQARLELARFLLAEDGKREADAELVALAANAPSTPELARALGRLFLQTDDADSAAEQFQIALKSTPQDPELLAGAGKAAFALRKYATARDYLARAESRGNTDEEVARLLELSDLILNSDPLDQRASWAIRARRTEQALAQATERIQACAAQGAKGGAAPEELSKMLSRLDDAQRKPRLVALRRTPDLLIGSAALAFAGEEAAAKFCGEPQGPDLALLLIGRSHPEVAR